LPTFTYTNVKTKHAVIHGPADWKIGDFARENKNVIVLPAASFSGQ